MACIIFCICIFTFAQLLILVSFKIYRENCQFASQGMFLNDHSMVNEILCTVYLVAWKIFLPITGLIFCFFLSCLIFNVNLPPFTGITLNIPANSWEFYLGITLITITFLEFLLIGIICALFCRDSSICKKNSWTSNTFYGNIAELFIKLYVMGDFAINTNVIHLFFI